MLAFPSMTRDTRGMDKQADKGVVVPVTREMKHAALRKALTNSRVRVIPLAGAQREYLKRKVS